MNAAEAVEFRVPFLPETFWLVTDELAVLELEAEGIGRGRIWTEAELAAINGVSRDEAHSIALAKMIFDGSLDQLALPGLLPKNGETLAIPGRKP